jgi:hypothetical protein
MTVIDDDVKVWVAARAVSLQKPEFSAQDVLESIQKLFKQDAKKMDRFVTHQCVANVPGGAGKHFNYLFKVGPNKYRMFKTGDPIEYTHAGGPTSPDVGRVPAEFRSFFAAGRIPEGLKPAESTRPAELSAGKPRAEAAGAKTAQALLEKPAGRAIPATKGLLVDMAELDASAPSGIARRTIFDLLFLEFGRLGSKLETKQGDVKSESFVIQHEKATGTVKTHQNFTIVLPSGGLIAHEAEIVVELESPQRILFIDIVEAATRTEEMKAHGFDALHNRKDRKQRYSILVYLRTPAGMLQEQAESIAYGYDFIFGADANDAKNSNKFYALKSHVLSWIEGKIKPNAGA